MFDREAIHSLRSQPTGILAHQAKLDVDELETDRLLSEDLLVFGLVFGLIARSQVETASALSAGQPACLIHTLPGELANPAPGSSLGEIALKTDHDSEIELVVGGRDPEGKFCEEEISLKPRLRTQLAKPYQSLAYLRASQPIPAQVGLSAKVLKRPTIARPAQWGNIWIYGMEVVLVGYLSRDEFRRQGTLRTNEAAGMPVTHGKKKSLPMGMLHPLAGLIEWARKA